MKDDTPNGEQPPDGKLAYSLNELCEVAAVGRTTVYAALKDGSLKARKRGRNTIILVVDALAWLHALPHYEPDKGASDGS